ncbi:MAG: hypothetical protein ABI445_21885 [Polyangia bacterium]
MTKPTSFTGMVDELEENYFGEERFADIALYLTRRKDKSTVLSAGGQWDRLQKRFTGRDAERAVFIELEESQIPFARFFAGWLRDFREGYPRDVSLVLNAGGRRGGKTFDTIGCTIAALIDVPFLPDGTPIVGWAISKTYRQREELDAFVAARFPSEMYHHRKAPDHSYTFAHGARMRNLSADDPTSLKQGRVDILFYNEAQLMSPRAIKNGLYGTSDQGGITLLAANPPEGPEGDWLRDLKDAIERDPLVKPITRFFDFPSKMNERVDSAARKKNAAIAKLIDPEMSDADDEGTWRQWGDLACPSFDKRTLSEGGHVGPLPEIGAEDITHLVTRTHFYSAYKNVIGADFQSKPQAAAILRVFRLPGVEGNVYWFADELGVKGTETELSTALQGDGHLYSPRGDNSAVWIGDCSGSYQAASRISGQTSYNLLEADGWKIFPAELVKSETSERPANPKVAIRLNLLQRLMQQGRIRVSPSCVWLVESFAKCKLKKTGHGTRVPTGRLAHILDAASYAVYRLEPKPKSNRPTLLVKGSYHTASRPRGIRTI